MKNFKCLNLGLALLAMPFCAVKAESLYELPIDFETQSREANSRFIFEIINDFLAPQGTDRYFTNGLRVGQTSDKLPKFIEWYDTDLKDEYYIVTLSQEIYTPEDIEESELINNDRPYAGWTYLTFALGKKDRDTLSLTVLDVGALGEGSQADKVQRNFHQAIGSTSPEGWENQLSSELGFALKHIRAKNFRVENENLSADLSIYAGGTLGNVRTSLEAGLTFRAGYNVPNSILQGHEYTNHRNFSLYGHIGARSSLVFRNAFIDGNTFKDSHSVERETFVNNYSLGLTAGLGDFSFSYIYDFWSPEFKGQQGSHNTGTFRLSYFSKFDLN